MQQRGWLQDDGGTQNACLVHEKGAQTGDETLSSAQVGSTLAAAIEDLSAPCPHPCLQSRAVKTLNSFVGDWVNGYASNSETLPAWHNE